MQLDGYRDIIQEFELLSKNERDSMLEDLYEFEKCYFINYFQVTPSYSEGAVVNPR